MCGFCVFLHGACGCWGWSVFGFLFVRGPDDVLRKGSGTLCESLLMNQAGVPRGFAEFDPKEPEKDTVLPMVYIL